MSLQSVNDILGKLQIQAQIRAQPFQRVLTIWHEVVGDRIAAQTRPVAIQRQVLRVATSSAAQAQNLMFQRQQILIALNSKLEQPLSDIRCSTAGWHLPSTNTTTPVTRSLAEHPSYIGDCDEISPESTLQQNILSLPSPNPSTSSANINIAFQHWSQKIQARSHNLPPCPQCQAPTPPGEIARWGVCSLCVAKTFADN